MAIISIAICDKLGKILLSRQFQSISKSSLEEMVKNFPKSIKNNQQHTFVEDNRVRYVFQPIEEFYILIITNKNSNIIEDLELMRLIQKLVSEFVTSKITDISEASFLDNAFELIMAFDEAVYMGLRENLTSTQIISNLSMESSEEKLHNILKKAQENEAKEIMKKMQMDSDKRKVDAMGISGGYSGMKSEPFIAKQSSDSFEKSISSVLTVSHPSATQSKGPKKGLQLTKKPTEKKRVESYQPTSDKIEEEESKIQYNPLDNPFEIEVKESITCALTKDNDLEIFKINGEVFALLKDKNKGKARIELGYDKGKKVNFTLPSSWNKSLWTDQCILALKNVEESIPFGQKLPLLKYKFKIDDESDTPFNVVFFFENGKLSLEIEYNENGHFKTIEDIEISINYPPKEKPSLLSNENSDVNFTGELLNWSIPTLSHTQASWLLEVQFSDKCKKKDLFPIQITFKSQSTILDLNVSSIKNIEDDSSILFDLHKSLEVEDFKIVM